MRRSEGTDGSGSAGVGRFFKAARREFHDNAHTCMAELFDLLGPRRVVPYTGQP